MCTILLSPRWSILHRVFFIQEHQARFVWPSVIPTKIPSNNPTDKVGKITALFPAWLNWIDSIHRAINCSKTHILMYMQYGEGVSIMPWVVLRMKLLCKLIVGHQCAELIKRISSLTFHSTHHHHAAFTSTILPPIGGGSSRSAYYYLCAYYYAQQSFTPQKDS